MRGPPWKSELKVDANSVGASPAGTIQGFHWQAARAPPADAEIDPMSGRPGNKSDPNLEAGPFLPNVVFAGTFKRFFRSFGSCSRRRRRNSSPSKGTDNRNKGSESRNKGKDNRNKGTDNRNKGTDRS